VMDDILFDQSFCPFTDEISRSSCCHLLGRCYCEWAALSIFAYFNSISNLGTRTTEIEGARPAAGGSGNIRSKSSDSAFS
jgi:hypothetical protein